MSSSNKYRYRKAINSCCLAMIVRNTKRRVERIFDPFCNSVYSCMVVYVLIFTFWVIAALRRATRLNLINRGKQNPTHRTGLLNIQHTQYHPNTAPLLFQWQHTHQKTLNYLFFSFHFRMNKISMYSKLPWYSPPQCKLFRAISSVYFHKETKAQPVFKNIICNERSVREYSLLIYNYFIRSIYSFIDCDFTTKWSRSWIIAYRRFVILR